ncbi:MAG: SDR family NAD(P)-dependent oxidoreductase, partial [Planctomycetota bacterium]|nr:SDR family NAD(P)-dependent oxidoreductase [Planctomycetota bacterium]
MGESALPLQGQVAVVTGASRGIGRSIAMKLASEGADLVLTARGVEGVEAVAAAVREQSPDRRVLPLGCDVSDWDSVSALIDRTLEEFERLDFLVNNAGITRDNLVLRMKQEEWDAVIATNLTGVFNTCRLAARQMLRQRS